DREDRTGHPRRGPPGEALLPPRSRREGREDQREAVAPHPCVERTVVAFPCSLRGDPARDRPIHHAETTRTSAPHEFPRSVTVAGAGSPAREALERPVREVARARRARPSELPARRGTSRRPAALVDGARGRCWYREADAPARGR